MPGLVLACYLVTGTFTTSLFCKSVIEVLGSIFLAFLCVCCDVAGGFYEVCSARTGVKMPLMSSLDEGEEKGKAFDFFLFELETGSEDLESVCFIERLLFETTVGS